MASRHEAVQGCRESRQQSRSAPSIMDQGGLGFLVAGLGVGANRVPPPTPPSPPGPAGPGCRRIFSPARPRMGCITPHRSKPDPSHPQASQWHPREYSQCGDITTPASKALPWALRSRCPSALLPQPLGSRPRLPTLLLPPFLLAVPAPRSGAPSPPRPAAAATCTSAITSPYHDAPAFQALFSTQPPEPGKHPTINRHSHQGLPPRQAQVPSMAPASLFLAGGCWSPGLLPAGWQQQGVGVQRRESLYL